MVGKQDTNGNYETYLEHVKVTGLQMLGQNCRIPFPDERIDARRESSEYTPPLESDAEFAALRTGRRFDSRTGQEACDQGTLRQLSKLVRG
jgi:hypothetical protein